MKEKKTYFLRVILDDENKENISQIVEEVKKHNALCIEQESLSSMLREMPGYIETIDDEECFDRGDKVWKASFPNWNGGVKVKEGLFEYCEHPYYFESHTLNGLYYRVRKAFSACLWSLRIEINRMGGNIK